MSDWNFQFLFNAFTYISVSQDSFTDENTVAISVFSFHTCLHDVSPTSGRQNDIITVKWTYYGPETKVMVSFRVVNANLEEKTFDVNNITKTF